MGDNGKKKDETSSCKLHQSSYTTVSRTSTRSVRAASLRLRQLEEQQRLEKAAEDTRRQLELARARHELEAAELEEEEAGNSRHDEREISLHGSSQDLAQCEPGNIMKSTSLDAMHLISTREPTESRRSEPIFIVKENPKLDILRWKVQSLPVFQASSRRSYRVWTVHRGADNSSSA